MKEHQYHNQSNQQKDNNQYSNKDKPKGENQQNQRDSNYRDRDTNSESSYNPRSNNSQYSHNSNQYQKRDNNQRNDNNNQRDNNQRNDNNNQRDNNQYNNNNYRIDNNQNNDFGHNQWGSDQNEQMQSPNPNTLQITQSKTNTLDVANDSIMTNLRRVHYTPEQKQCYSYTIQQDPYIPDDNHMLKNLFYESVVRKQDLDAKIGANFIQGNKVFGKQRQEDDQVQTTRNFKTDTEQTLTLRFEKEIKDDLFIINCIHKKQLYNDGFSKKKNQNKKYDQFVEKNDGSNYKKIDGVEIKYLNGFSTHLSKRGEDFQAMTNPCGRFVHNTSLHDTIHELSATQIFNLRFKNGDAESPLELVQVSYDREINKTYKILHIINNVNMEEKDPVKRFGVDLLPHQQNIDENTIPVDNQVQEEDGEEEQEWRFKSYMQGNDFEHLVVSYNKASNTYLYKQNYVNHYHEIIYDQQQSFKEQFSNNQQYDIKHPIQSIVICKSKDNEFQIKPAEVCYINHLPHQVNASKSFKKLQNQYTKNNFEFEIEMIDNLVRNMNVSDMNKELLGDLSVHDKVVSIEEYFTISPPNLKTHNQVLNIYNNSKFFNSQIREFQSKRRVNNCIILQSNKMKPYIQFLKNKFISCYKQKGCNFGYVETMFIDHNQNKNWERMLDSLVKDYEVVILLIPKFLNELYQKFKIYQIFSERTVVQVIRESTIVYLYCDQEGCRNYSKQGQKYPQYCAYHKQENMRNFDDSDESRLHSIVNNVVYEISRKLYNQAPWVVEFKHKRDYLIPYTHKNHTMFVGIDVCHSINNHKKPSVFVISNSLDPELKDWTSEHLILDKQHREFITKEAFLSLFKRCLAKFQKYNSDWPKLLIIQRDGIGDAEEKQGELEIEWLKEIAPEFGSYKIIQIAVNKNNLLRLSKPMLPGSIVDAVGVTQKENHFQIFTTLGRKSKNIIPKYCKVMINQMENDGLSQESIYKITFQLCYCYYSQAGVISIPVPIKLADKRAQMVYNFKMEDVKEFQDKQQKRQMANNNFKEINFF